MDRVQDHATFPLEFAPGQIINFRYRNWQGVTADRSARIISLVYGSTDWHPEAQWLLKAFDFEKQAERLFAIRDMVPRE